MMNPPRFKAKSFVSSCEEQIRYCLNDTFLTGIYASAPVPSAGHERQPPSEENPELAVLHHALATSHADTTTACATVAHLNSPRDTTPSLRATLGRHNPVAASDAATSPPLGPEPKGYTPVYDPDSAHNTVTRRHFDDLSTTLHTQTQRVDDVMTDVIRHVEDGATFIEMKTLAVIAGDSSKRTTHFLTMEQPTEAERPKQTEKHEKAGTSPANTARSNCSDTPESERHVTRCAGMATACTTTKREQPALIPPGTYTDLSSSDIPSMENMTDRPVFIPTDRNWCYLGSRDAPSVRQVEIIQRLM